MGEKSGEPDVFVHIGGQSMMSQIILRALYGERPIASWEEVLLQLVQAARPDTAKDELRRSLERLAADRLVQVVKHAPDHIISAKRWADGRITITTIDGQKYHAPEAH